MLGVDNLDAKRQGQYETFQDLIDKGTEHLMYAGEITTVHPALLFGDFWFLSQMVKAWFYRDF